MKHKHKSRLLRQWLGTIMCVMGVGSAIFFSYVKVSNLWHTVDEAGDITGQTGLLILIFGSLLLVAGGIQMLLPKRRHRKNRKFRFTFPH